MGVLQVQAGQLAIASTLLQRSLEDGVARRGVHRSLGLSRWPGMTSTV